MGRRRSILIASCVALGAAYGGCTNATSDAAPDTDGDGLSDAEETNLYGTSPVLADTDGDGWSDYDEVVKHAFDPANNPYRFNPRVADVPRMEIRFTGPPSLTIQLTDTTGVTQTFQTTYTTGSSTSVTNSETRADSRSDTLSTSETVSQQTEVSGSAASPGGTDAGADAADAGAGAKDAGADARDGVDDPADAAGDAAAEGGGGPAQAGAAAGDDGGPGAVMVTLTNGVSSTVSPSTTVQTSVAFTAEQTQEINQTLSQAQSYEELHDIAASAGILKMTAVIDNRGHLAFRVYNLILSATIVNALGVVLPVGNLIVDEGILTGFQPFASTPGEPAAPINFVAAPLTLPTAQAVLGDARALDVQLGAYELDDAQGRPFAFDFTEIGDRTALMHIEYAGQRPGEVYLVATNLNPLRPGVTAATALEDILRIPYEAAGDVGLTAVRGVGANASGTGFWAVDHRHDDGADVVMTHYDATAGPYEFNAIELRAGDVLHVFYVAP